MTGNIHEIIFIEKRYDNKKIGKVEETLSYLERESTEI